MCGFCGVYYISENKGIRADYDGSASQYLRHRGPDDKGFYSDENIRLYFNRLSIIDLSKAGHQPMCNERQDIWLVCNGEIYNYLELASELKSRNHTFKSKSDSEVIIHSYEDYGIRYLSRFNGMWSFVIYDKRNRQ